MSSLIIKSTNEESQMISYTIIAQPFVILSIIFLLLL